MTTFNEALRIGTAGERQVREWLMEQGFYVIPMADIRSHRNRAPSLEGRDNALVLADLQVYGQQSRAWVEVKTKKNATHYDKLRRWEHGLETRLWDDYQALCAASAIEGWLCILEEEPIPRILLATFAELDRVKRRYDGDKMPGGRPHVFFPCSVFATYAGPSEKIAMPEPIAPRTVKKGARAPQLSFDVSGFASPESGRDLHTPIDLRRPRL